MFGKLASLFVEIKSDAGHFNAGVDGVQARVGALAGSLGRLSAQAASVFAAVGVAAAAAATVGLYKAVNAAGDLNESASKLEAFFGPGAEAVKSYAQEMADKFGVVKKEIYDGVANIGLLGIATGMTDAEAAKLGVRFAKLAVDLESIHNVPFAEMIDKLRSGLSGEAEPLRAIGVFLSEDAVKAEALARGIAKSAEETKNLTESQKVLARISLIENAPAIAKAVGDKERTADSYNNLAKKLSGTFANLAAEVGQALLPVAGQVVEMLTSAATTVGAFFKGCGETIATAAQYALQFFKENAEAALGLARDVGSAVLPALKEMGLLVLEVALAGKQLAGGVIRNVMLPALRALMAVISGIAWLLRTVLEVIERAFGMRTVAQEIDHLTEAINALPKASKDAAAKMKADFEAVKAPVAQAAKAAADPLADKDKEKDEPNFDHSNNGADLTAEERARRGLRLKPGQMLRAIPERGQSEFHDLVGFSKQLQTGLLNKPDDTGRRQIVEIQGVRHEIVEMTQELVREQRETRRTIANQDRVARAH